MPKQPRNPNSESKAARPPAWARVAAFVALIAVLAILNARFGWSETLMGTDAVARMQDALAAHPVEAAITYVALSVVGCVALALPGIAFAIVAGVVFGPWLGTVLCWLSMTIGACLSFLVGRYFLKDAIGPRLARNPTLDRFLFQGAGKSDVYLLAVTRLVPLFPYNVQNFAYGITDIGFAPYALYSGIFIFPGTAMYTLAAAGFTAGADAGVCFAAAALLLAGSVAIAAVLKRKAHLE